MKWWSRAFGLSPLRQGNNFRKENWSFSEYIHMCSLPGIEVPLKRKEAFAWVFKMRNGKRREMAIHYLRIESMGWLCQQLWLFDKVKFPCPWSSMVLPNKSKYCYILRKIYCLFFLLFCFCFLFCFSFLKVTF